MVDAVIQVCTLLMLFAFLYAVFPDMFKSGQPAKRVVLPEEHVDAPMPAVAPPRARSRGISPHLAGPYLPSLAPIGHEMFVDPFIYTYTGGSMWEITGTDRAPVRGTAAPITEGLTVSGPAAMIHSRLPSEVLPGQIIFVDNTYYRGTRNGWQRMQGTSEEIHREISESFERSMASVRDWHRRVGVSAPQARDALEQLQRFAAAPSARARAETLGEMLQRVNVPGGRAIPSGPTDGLVKFEVKKRRNKKDEPKKPTPKRVVRFKKKGTSDGAPKA